MVKMVTNICAALALVGVGGVGPACLAKPPDLPVDLGADFQDTETHGTIMLGIDLFTGKLSLRVQLPWPLKQQPLPEATSGSAGETSKSRTNAVCPPRTPASELASYAQWTIRLNCSNTEASEPESDARTLKHAQARALFDIAERCLHTGDLDKARTCYEETHLLAPQTTYGRKAIKRLTDLDSVWTGTLENFEEQEPKATEPVRPRP